MNENINLVKILKNCPRGWKLWSPIFGVVEFEKILEKHNIVIIDVGNGELWTFNSDATFPIGNFKSVEIMLYPSRENRDWSKFTAPWCNLEKQRDKDKLMQERGEYKVKNTQEVSEKCINSMSNKDDERLRKTAIAFLKDFAEQSYENAVECIDWLEKLK